MAEKRRHVEPGHIYHVLNRAVNRQTMFYSESDYWNFEQLITQTLQLIGLPILTYQLMPNHWHFVVQPESKEQLSSFFHRLAGTHAKRFRTFRETVGDGHLYQDRFKSFPVQSDEHFFTLCRYVERNALKAGLVRSAEDWRWGGLWAYLHGRVDICIGTWPLERPSAWIQRVNTPLTPLEQQEVETSLRRNRPFGSAEWTRAVANKLGLVHTLRRPGRPRAIAPANLT